MSSYYKAEDYISHTETSKGIVNRVYKLVRNKTLARKRKLAEKFTGLKEGRALDFGCGTGSFVNELSRYGWQVTGLEPDGDARAVSKKLYGLDILDTSAFFKLKAGDYDIITLWHVLEHIHELNSCIQQLKKLLSDRGKIFIAVPNYTAADASRYKEFWAAYDVPRHLYHFSPVSMNHLMQKNGLRIIACKPMWYDSFYISLLSTKYKSGRPDWLGAGWTGFRSNLAALFDTKKCSSVIYVVEK
jgi:SAM-dependent methyltransferase